MGMRFRRSTKIGPFRINASKSGVGWSVGGKSVRYTQKANGGTRVTVNTPVKGVYATKDFSAKQTQRNAAPQPSKSNKPGCLTWIAFLIVAAIAVYLLIDFFKAGPLAIAIVLVAVALVAYLAYMVRKESKAESAQPDSESEEMQAEDEK